MRRSSLNTIAFIVCLLPAAMLLAPAPASLAQSGAGRKGVTPAAAPVLKISVDKQRILIGEPIQLMLEVTVPGGMPLVWPVLDSLPHFEWVEKGNVDSTVKPGERYYRQYTTITSWDSGAWVIPRLPFVSGRKTYLSDSVHIDVGYTKIDPSKDYHDIKDIIEVPNPLARWFGWIVAAIALISIGLVAWLIGKKKILKRLAPDQAPLLSPYEAAIRQLDELERQHLPENGSVKIYYSRLNDIFREFLHRRLGISSLAETSEELIGQLRRLPLAAEQYSATAEMLRMGDFVKFAKYQPGLADSERHYRVIRGSVDALNKIEEERAAAVRAADVAAESTNHQTKQ